MRFYFLFALTAAVFTSVLPSSSQAIASEKNDARMKFFELHIRPLLSEKCYSCHGPKEQKGSLRVDSLSGLITGGDSGELLEPGNVENSYLIEVISDYDSYGMPPSGPLSKQEVQLISQWVAEGAFWPGDDGTNKVEKRSAEKVTEEDRQWWAYQLLNTPTQKQTAQQMAAEIDRQIAQGRDEHKVSAARKADRLTLLRRVAYSLTGLPPDQELLSSFSQQEGTSFRDVVDHLLQRPQYGERMGRMWLDVVRYAESDGYRADGYRSNAWRYRDYVIKSFNEDKPYDQFLKEQIAGEELYPNSVEAQIASGYLLHGIYEYNSRDAEGQHVLLMDELTDTVGDSILAMGLQCAKCHDHKFDPILQKDYFQIQSVFASIQFSDETYVDDGQNLAKYENDLTDLRKQHQELYNEYDQLTEKAWGKAKHNAVKKFPAEVQEMYKKPEAEKSVYEKQISLLVERQVDFEYARLQNVIPKEKRERYSELKKSIEAIERAVRPTKAIVARDFTGTPPDVTIPKRKPDPVPTEAPVVLQSEKLPFPEFDQTEDSNGRRIAFADWITHPKHPLTARVIVNRVWQMHFGRGLAPNANDFGKLGGEPTHPELLTVLSEQFIANGWSLKWLHQAILSSHTYQLDSQHDQMQEMLVIDPMNQWYWKSNVRRLDAEQIRDALIVASGGMDLKMGGPAVSHSSSRRSVYAKVRRNTRDPLLDIFDLPQFFVSSPKRDQTTTAIQSLHLLNDKQMWRLAEKLASRMLESEADQTQTEESVTALWKELFQRTPTQQELELTLLFLEEEMNRLEQQEPEQLADQIDLAPFPSQMSQALKLTESQSIKRPFADPSLVISDRDFSVTVQFQVDSIYSSGAVRTLVSRWAGSGRAPGWAVGITGKGSRRRPQTVVIQLYGRKTDGSFGEAALFSDQHVELGVPYELTARVHYASTTSKGTVEFELKPLKAGVDVEKQLVEIPHSIVGGVSNREPITIGGHSTQRSGLFDGLIDDVELKWLETKTPADGSQPPARKWTSLVNWTFETMENPLADRLHQKHPLMLVRQTATQKQAWIALCHLLLNSNQFLYVE